jgi:vacuolar-type H+-ATPase subunit E/Vma4
VSEANEFAAAVTAEAEAEAKTISEEFESTAEKEHHQIVDTACDRANEIMHRSNAQSMKEKRINILSAKWEYLDNAFLSAVKLLSKQPEEEQVRFMASLVQKYQRADAELIFNAADGSRIGQAVTDQVNAAAHGVKVTLSEKHGDFSGGLIMKEGGVETNLTYEALVSARREQLEEAVSGILFEQV